MNPLDPEAKTETATTPASPGDSSAQLPVAPLDLPPPDIPDYELVKRIGHGSYGEVWLARNVLGTYHAVKIVSRQTFEDARPFEREFEGIQRFEPISRLHESQVTILHVGRKADYFYYVMELADDAGERSDGVMEPRSDGNAPSQSSSTPTLQHSSSYSPKTLRSEIKRRGQLPFAECLQIALKLTEALGHLHQHKLVHRDVKPSNVIFVNGRPKLADIGLVAGTDVTLSFVGTEGYLPPEGPGKPPADIYSLGKVIYEISTGRDRNEYPELPTLWKTSDERESFAELNEVILKACASDLQKRYETAEQMHEDLVLVEAGKSLRRSRAVERRLALLTKVSVAGIALTTLVIAGYLYQQVQTRVARQLARQNELQIAQLHEKDGLRLMEEGDLIGSLPWFGEALTRAQGDAEAERRHRFRIGAILRQCPRLLQIIHEPRVTVAEFSPDGRRLVTSGTLTNNEQYISEWSLPEGRLLQRIETGLVRPETHVAPIALSPEGRRVIVWDPRPELHALHTYHLDSGKLTGQPPVHQAGIREALFSADGRHVLTASRDRTARLWRADSGELLTTLTHDDDVLSAAMDANGDRILTVCTNGTAYLWDAHTGQRMHVVDLGPKGAEWGIPPMLSPDDRWAVIGSGDDAQVWDLRTGAKLHTLPTKEGMESLRISPDGELVLTAFSKARVWEASTGEALTPPLDKGLSYWTTARFSPDGSRVISGSEAGVAMIWDARTGANVWPPLRSNAGLAWFGNGVRFSPDGRMALMVSRAVYVWDMTGANSELPTLWHSGGVNDLSFSPDGRLVVTASDDHTARVWDAQSGRAVTPPLRHEVPVVLARFTADGARILTAGFDGTARLWNAKTGEPVCFPLRHGAPVRKAEFSRDGKWILTMSTDNRVCLWDGDSGQQSGNAILHGGRDGLSSASFTPDSRKVITVGGGTAKAWAVPTGEPMAWEMANWNYSGLEFSRDGRTALVGARPGGTQVLDAETFVPITPRFSHPNERERDRSWSPDATKVVTVGEDQTARLWDARTGKELVPAMMHPHGVGSPSFSDDGRWILTIGGIEDGAGDALYVWDANSGLLAAPPFRQAARIRSATFSPDGHRILAGCADGSVRALDFTPYEGSVEDLKGIVEVFSGRWIAGTTLAQAVGLEAIKATYDQLREKFPQYFSSSTNDVVAWHRREAEDRARSRQRFAANFHVNQVQALTGDTAEFRAWQEQVVRRRYPPRDPGAPAHCVDLTDFYTAPLTGYRYHPYHLLLFHGLSGSEGLRRLSGVDFDVRGLVHVGGGFGIGKELGHPAGVRGIAVRRHAKLLHFLQAASGSTRDGIETGKYIVHYANGERREIPLLYGEHLANYLYGGQFPNRGTDRTTTRDLPQAKLAWTSDDRFATPGETPVRLYKFTWSNPLPDQEIVALDFISSLAEAAPFLVALTVE